MTRVAPNYVQINTYDVIHIYPPQRNISAVCLQNVVTMMLQYFALPFCCFSKEPKWWLYVRHPFNFPPLLRACYISNKQVLSVATFFFILYFPLLLICRPKHLKKATRKFIAATIKNPIPLFHSNVKKRIKYLVSLKFLAKPAAKTNFFLSSHYKQRSSTELPDCFLKKSHISTVYRFLSLFCCVICVGIEKRINLMLCFKNPSFFKLHFSGYFHR